MRFAPKSIILAALIGLLLPGIGLAANHVGARPSVTQGSIFLPIITNNYDPQTDCSVNPWLISPANGSVTSARPTFGWNFGNNPGAQIGRYEISKSATFAGLLEHWGQYEYPEGTLDQPLFALSSRLDLGVTHYWRARVQCLDGRWLSSPVWSFTPSAGVAPSDSDGNAALAFR